MAFTQAQYIMSQNAITSVDYLCPTAHLSNEHNLLQESIPKQQLCYRHEDLALWAHKAKCVCSITDRISSLLNEASYWLAHLISCAHTYHPFTRSACCSLRYPPQHSDYICYQPKWCHNRLSLNHHDHYIILYTGWQTKTLISTTRRLRYYRT